MTSDNFVNKRNMIFYLRNCIVDEKRYSCLNLKTVLSYFEDGQRLLGFKQEGEYVLDRGSSLFNDLNADYATISAFFIEKGYYVYTDDESGYTVIDLH